MEKRLIVALVLSVIVMMVFQKVMPAPQKQAAQVVAMETQPIAKEALTQKVMEKNLEEKLFVQETDQVEITFSNINGAIKSIKLKEYDFTLFDETNPSQYLFNTVDLQPYGLLQQHQYQVETQQNKIIFSYNDPKRQYIIKKIYSVPTTGYDIGLSIISENTSEVTTAYKYETITVPVLNQVSDVKGRQFLETNALVNGTLVKKNKIKTDQETLKGIIGWTAIKNRYFLVAVQTPKTAEQLIIEKVNKKDLKASVVLEPQILAPGQISKQEFVLIAAPLKKGLLSKYGIGLEGTVNYGFFGGISSILLSLLGFIYKLVHNWGVAIICVTILINMLLFPLTKKSMHSMHKMQELQPHMERLRTLHKDNPQKMNKEVMELYKEYNVNPFGGCLPMLLQFPVFIAFYQALMRSTELKNAGFLWIKDLSRPDALFLFPHKLPLLGTSFNLLPILTLLLMVLQQRISTSGQKNISPEMAQQQKMMALIFPLFFGFILYNFPAGLVLYWMTNSILMTTEQYFLKKNIGK